MSTKSIRKRTFTLLELLVVLLIIGTLTALAVSEYMDSDKLTKMRIFESNVHEIKKNLSVYSGNRVLLGEHTNPYPLSLSDPEFKKLFRQEPINPYTGKSMLSSAPTDSGIQYQSDGTSYSICIAQQDVDDINNNGRTDEPLPITLYPACTGTLPSVTYFFEGFDDTSSLNNWNLGEYTTASIDVRAENDGALHARSNNVDSTNYSNIYVGSKILVSPPNPNSFVLEADLKTPHCSPDKKMQRYG